MKKILAFVLAMVMVFALGVSALADELDIVIAPGPITPIPAKYVGHTVILHTNDVHGAIEGYAYVAALKAEYEAQGAEVILVDAGDYSQGTTYVSTTKGADAVDMMNVTGYDIATLGNHEFDYGYAQLAENMKKAEFKVICADILDAEGKPVFDANYTYTNKGGLKIGFFGLDTPEAQTKTNPALIQGLTFLTGDELFAAAQAQVEALADADLVVCLAHLGVDDESEPYRSTDLAAKVSGIDIIIDGHSHTVMTEGENGEAIQSTGTAVANIGVIVIDNQTRSIVDNYLYEITEESAKDETVAAAAQVIVDRVKAEYGQVFAKSEVTLNGAKAPNGNRDSETNNGDLITDAMIWQVMQNKEGLKVADDMVVAITNGGGIRAAINPGDVTKQDINTVLPFGNTVALVYVTGAELLEALEASTYCTPTSVGGFPQVAGMEFTLDTTEEYDAQEETYPDSTYYGPKSINRVTIDSINGKAFDAEATYAVITNNFCAAGGDTYYAFAAAKEQFDTGVPLDEAVMAYVTEELGGVIGEKYAEPQGRITIKGINPFADVAEDAYYKDAVVWAHDNGVTNGVSETEFAPDSDITCEQAMTMIYRYIDSIGKGFTGANMFPLTCADADQVSEWAFNAVRFGVMKQVLVADEEGNLNPKATLARADLVTMLYKLAELFGDDVTETLNPDTNYLDYSELVDVMEADPELHTVLVWAQDRGVLEGDGEGNLMPFDTLTRAHFVTMLYRLVNLAK